MAGYINLCTKRDKGLNIRQIALFGVLGALTFGAKVAMSGLPNIEPVSLFVMVFAAVFGWKALYPVMLYVVMEILLYGISFWNINYLYVWPILVAVSVGLRRCQRAWIWALVAAAFGLCFGLLCAPVYMVVGGSFSYGIRWWLAGLGFDCTHAIGNFVMVLALFAPLRKALEKLYNGQCR